MPGPDLQTTRQPFAGGPRVFPCPPLPTLLVSASVLVVGCLLRSLLCVVFVPGSMPAGVYRLHPPGRSRSSLALLCLPSDLARFGRARGYLGWGFCPAGTAAVLKPIVAEAGDRVAMSTDGVRVNGVLLPNSAPLDRDRQGRPLEAYSKAEFVVPPGSYLVVSCFSALSWDGRYWGPLPVKTMRARAERVGAGTSSPVCPSPHASRPERRSGPTDPSRDANAVRVGYVSR